MKCQLKSPEKFQCFRKVIYFFFCQCMGSLPDLCSREKAGYILQCENHMMKGITIQHICQEEKPEGNISMIYFIYFSTIIFFLRGALQDRNVLSIHCRLKSINQAHQKFSSAFFVDCKELYRYSESLLPLSQTCFVILHKQKRECILCLLNRSMSGQAKTVRKFIVQNCVILTSQQLNETLHTLPILMALQALGQRHHRNHHNGMPFCLSISFMITLKNSFLDKFLDLSTFSQWSVGNMNSMNYYYYI